jgi:anaerobic selenocysteine-containing dehydrogenase
VNQRQRIAVLPLYANSGSDKIISKGAVKIQGDPESPLNKGKMCPKGLASIEHLYHPDRLKYPLMRTGERGEGKWKRISWDEALDRIAGKILDIKKKHGIESVAVGMGTGRYHYLHVVRFVNRIGTPNWCEPGTAQCFIPRVLTSLITYGDITWCDYYRFVSNDFVWGYRAARIIETHIFIKDNICNCNK